MALILDDGGALASILGPEVHSVLLILIAEWLILCFLSDVAIEKTLAPLTTTFLEEDSVLLLARVDLFSYVAPGDRAPFLAVIYPEQHATKNQDDQSVDKEAFYHRPFGDPAIRLKLESGHKKLSQIGCQHTVPHVNAKANEVYRKQIRLDPRIGIDDHEILLTRQLIVV